MPIDKNTRNTLVELFQSCRQKWLLQQNWTSIESDVALSIGLCVHAGLQVWQFGGSDEKALEALLTEAARIQPDEVKLEVLEKGTELLQKYFQTYRQNRIKMIAAETPLPVELGNGWIYHTRLDGLGEHMGKAWIVSYKTTSSKPGPFFDKYKYDRQAQGELWCVRKAFPTMNIAGILLDALFKTKTIPFERRTIIYTDKELNDWYEETLAITKDMEGDDPELGPRIYRAGNFTCIRGSKVCEFWGAYCSLGMDEKLLYSTHKKGVNLGLLPWRKEKTDEAK